MGHFLKLIPSEAGIRIEDGIYDCPVFLRNVIRVKRAANVRQGHGRVQSLI